LEAGLREAGIAIRASKYGLKESAPKKWRTYLMGLWRRHQHNPAVQKLYQSKLLIGQELLRQFVVEHPRLNLPVPFDNGYTQPAFCRFLPKTLQVPYGGTLAGEDQVPLAMGDTRLDEFDRHLQHQHQQALPGRGQPLLRKLSITYKGNKETYDSYCHTHRLHNFGKQRLVINQREADLSDAATFVISNKLTWQAGGITRIRRPRWPVEVYHEEGKAEGLDQSQVRGFEALSRHIALVAVTDSLLRAVPHDQALLHKLQQQIETTLGGSAGSWRRHTQAQALWALASFIATALAQGQSLSEGMTPLVAPLSY
jgi:hypothetical protein